MDFLAKNKATAGKARKSVARRRSFEGGDLNTAHDKANMFGNMVSECYVLPLVCGERLTSHMCPSGCLDNNTILILSCIDIVGNAV